MFHIRSRLLRSTNTSPTSYYDVVLPPVRRISRRPPNRARNPHGVTAPSGAVLFGDFFLRDFQSPGGAACCTSEDEALINDLWVLYDKLQFAVTPAVFFSSFDDEAQAVEPETLIEIVPHVIGAGRVVESDIDMPESKGNGRH